ncbi:MAG: hypothetical protein ACD_7C00013G0001 [uncultured bacterium]|nr:MAG: hypothetical protein ACD_7C00013G0001 [uncultured bacterium]
MKILTLENLTEIWRPTRITGSVMKSIKRLKKLPFSSSTISSLLACLKRIEKKLTMLKKKTKRMPLAKLKFNSYKINISAPKDIRNIIA